MQSWGSWSFPSRRSVMSQVGVTPLWFGVLCCAPGRRKCPSASVNFPLLGLSGVVTSGVRNLQLCLGRCLAFLRTVMSHCLWPRLLLCTGGGVGIVSSGLQSRLLVLCLSRREAAGPLCRSQLAWRVAQTAVGVFWWGKLTVWWH